MEMTAVLQNTVKRSVMRHCFCPILNPGVVVSVFHVLPSLITKSPSLNVYVGGKSRILQASQEQSNTCHALWHLAPTLKKQENIRIHAAIASPLLGRCLISQSSFLSFFLKLFVITVVLLHQKRRVGDVCGGLAVRQDDISRY
jgi:hypothetical protein